MNRHPDSHRPGKRQRMDSGIPDTTINSAADLHWLLTSCQPSSLEWKTALQQFKAFLTGITRSVDQDDLAVKLQILKKYSEEQILVGQHESRFPDLLTPWASAAEANNETHLSLIPSVLALYLKAISTQLEFREIGAALGKYLLSDDQLRFLDRGLNATKTKEHLISPCLRLLTEIVSFDGGELAHLVYLKRETTLRRLELFLDQRMQSPEEGEAAAQKPTLRRIAQRYLLVNLKFQSPAAKGVMVADGKALKACLHGLRNDKADMVGDVLSSLEKHIVHDRSLATHFKTRFFTSSNLSLLASLYGSDNAADEMSPKSPRTLMDSLLRQICTQQDCGVLLAENGWYPVGSSPDLPLASATDSSNIALTNSASYLPTQSSKISIRNVVLSTFIQGLQPEVDKLQASLLLDIFRAAPELVADYFSRKKDFIIEPKDTPNWLGQSAFFFSVIQLPVPEYCGWKDGYPLLPPLAPIVVESILPRPLGRASLTRSLNLNHEVITLFAVRALTVAFQKLENVLKTFPQSWGQASSNLSLAFSQRIPLPRDIISTLHRTPNTDEQLRGAITELLTKYHQIVPHLMLSEKFDVSLALVDNIKRIGEITENKSVEASRLIELDSLLRIAQSSSDTKWLQKPDSLKYSLLASAIHAISLANGSVHPVGHLQEVLRAIVIDQGVLPSKGAYLDALMATLRPQEDWMPSVTTISFFDNCVGRIARQPVYYQDMADALGSEDAGDFLLQVCIAEQWQFVAKQEDQEDQKDIMQWITRLFIGLVRAGASRTSTERLHTGILQAISDTAVKKTVRKQFKEGVKMAYAPPHHQQKISQDPSPVAVSGQKGDSMPSRLEVMFPPQQKRTGMTEGLDNVSPKHVGEIVDDGRLGQLCIKLASSAEESRRKAFITLQALMKQIELSDYSEKKPLFVMTGELLESTRALGIAKVLPSVLAEFAAGAVKILSQPSHAMYSKVNSFLQKSPRWEVSRFLRYWLGNVLLLEPEEDHGRLRETTWLLNLLVRGLATNEDLEAYRKSNVFESILALYMSRLCTDSHRRQILELVYHAINLGEGMTLVTRMGLESWFALAQADGINANMVQELGDRLDKTVDRQSVQQWKLPAVEG